ncbi:hypothetical protein HY490_02225 [Candidatus Woesearchaeota archaeon]|nr:hypothetical protein [Candidatus Woesearchaeota archaeon]
MKTKVVSEAPVPFAHVKKLLEEAKERDGELSFRAQKTYEYLEQFSPLDKKKTDDLIKKLNSLEVPRLKDIHVCKLADLLPVDPKDVKTILQGYALTVTNENLQKVADTVKEFVK